MKNLFAYDGPVFRFSETLLRFVVTNLLTLLCCVPLITVGSAFAAHQKVMQDIVLDNHQPMLRTYFFAMWSNFRQATGLWLIFLVTVFFLAADFYFIYILTKGILSTVLFVALGIMAMLLMGLTACCFSLIVRYENTLKEHIRNALYLMMSHFPRILGMALVMASPLLLALLDFVLFCQIFPLWLVIGISLLVYLQALLAKPLFQDMEDAREKSLLEENSLNR